MDIGRKQKLTEIIFDNIHGGIIMLDRNYRILAINNYVEKWTGKPTSDLIDKNSKDVFHDIIGICPHCVAKVTFETGEVNTMVQKGNLKDNTYYMELSAYPIKDETGEVSECVVSIQDITERMLCHEKILSLDNEITRTKEYLEGIIENSPDAIVTSDLNGIITSWNKGAEKIYGFTKEEAIGKFLPFVPEFLIDPEWENNQRIRNGEVLKDIETLRKRKDGTVITVSLTLSPIKDAAGKVIGISCISRDISEKKRVEKELIRRNQELSRLFFISSAMRGTLELDRLLRMVLTAVTMSEGLGFNSTFKVFIPLKINPVRKGRALTAFSIRN
ncbi:MAG: PAS domain S-box protein [Nitrospirota bacterium]